VTDRIELRGLRVVARVGVLPQEQAADQPLEVDLDLEVDLVAAGASDALSDTVDYGAVCDAVVAALRAGHVDLLERLAARVVDATFAVDERIAAVDLAVRKLRPPVPHDLATSGVRVARARAAP
jgi:dihydroneopterin aldolase